MGLVFQQVRIKAKTPETFLQSYQTSFFLYSTDDEIIFRKAYGTIFAKSLCHRV